MHTNKIIPLLTIGGTAFILIFLLFFATRIASANSLWISATDPEIDTREVLSLPIRPANEFCNETEINVYSERNGLPHFHNAIDCMIKTKYGMVGKNHMILGRSGSALRMEAPGTPFLSGGETDRLILTTPTSAAAQTLKVFLNPLTSFKKQSTAAPWHTAYKTDLQANWHFRDNDGQDILVRALAASRNGRWLVAETTFGLTRIDLHNFEFINFSSEIPSYGYGINPHLNMAISDDGDYVAVAGANMPAFHIYGLQTCRSPAVKNSQEIVTGCGKKDLSSYMHGRIPNYRDSRFLQFNIFATALEFYATSTDGKKYEIHIHVPFSIERQMDYLALGDSFSSGEGEWDDKYYLPGTNGETGYEPGIDLTQEKCHISSRSYPFIFARATDSSVNSIACSGALINDVLDISTPTDENYLGHFEQMSGSSSSALFYAKKRAVDYLIPGRAGQIEFVKRYQPKVITLTMGGNNVGFAQKLTVCANPFSACTFAQPENRSKTAMEIKGQFAPLRDMYKDIQAASRDSKVYVIGYPHFFAYENFCSDVNVAGMLSQESREFVKFSVEYMNQVINAAAKAAQVQYVDIEDSLQGSTLCSGLFNKKSVNGIVFGDDMKILGNISLFGHESFHPNPYGHELMAQKISKEIGNPFTQPYDPCKGTCPTVNNPPSPPSYFNFVTSNVSVQSGRFVATNKPLQKGRPMNIQIKTTQLSPESEVRVELHSDPIQLATTTVDANGNIIADVHIPDTVKAGQHTLHIFSQAPSGEKVDLYQPLAILGKDGDIDEDGVDDKNDACLFVSAAKIDRDQDSIDDACDGDIGTAPGENLYRVRSGVVDKGEVEHFSYIERNVQVATQVLGISGDYDPDGDGWAIVGQSNSANSGSIARLWVDETQIPHLAMRHASKGCVQVTPNRLDVVRVGQKRNLRTEAKDTNTCRDPKADADVDKDAVADNIQDLYRVRFGDATKGESVKKIYVERNVTAAEAQLGKSDFDKDKDGWVAVGISREFALANPARLKLVVHQGQPHALFLHKNKGCTAITPKKLDTVRERGTRTAVLGMIPDGASCE